MLIDLMISGNVVPDNLFPLADINFDNSINTDDVISLIYLIINSY